MSKELVFAVITVLATSLTGSLIFDIFSAIVAYSSARLFWYYFGAKIKNGLNQIKGKKWILIFIIAFLVIIGLVTILKG